MQEKNHKIVWVVDPVHTKIRFATKYLLITYISGWFTQIEGVIRASMDDFSDARVLLTIYTHSVDTGNNGVMLSDEVKVYCDMQLLKIS